MKDLVKERVIVALDVATEKEAIDLVIQLREHVGFFKVGLELLNSAGIHIVQNIVGLGGNVFLDGKFMDIPNTVAGASKASTRMGVKMFNVHTMGGVEMMNSAVKATQGEASRLGIERPLILGVTILTSLDKTKMNKEIRIPGDIEGQVVHLAGLAKEAGLDGVIASPHEIEVILKHVSARILIVTPGIRPSWSIPQDQKRIMTPREAILRGASHLVIGRPIISPPAEIGTPIDAVKRVVEEIATAL